VAFGQIQIVAHAELIPVTNHRRSGEREHEAVRKLDAASVARQHRCEPAANPTPVQLHAGVWAELLEDSGSLRRGEATQVQLVVVAQELPPLSGCGPGFGFADGRAQGSYIPGSEGIEEVLVHL